MILAFIGVTRAILNVILNVYLVPESSGHLEWSSCQILNSEMKDRVNN